MKELKKGECQILYKVARAGINPAFTGRFFEEVSGETEISDMLESAKKSS
jgi:hypothetical protein